jgi:hypothetical protein
LATLLVAGVLFLVSTAQPADAGLWDAVKEWYTAFQLGEVDEASIPQKPVELVGEVSLLLKDQVELAFDEDTPGIGTVHWMDFSPEGTILIADFRGKQALEFSFPDGRYIRSFGRQGNGPGEYGSPKNMAIDPQGQVYLLDGAFGQILRYDRQGRYSDRRVFYKGSSILTGRGGEIFLLKKNQMNIVEVQRLDPDTWEDLYRTPVSTDQKRLISYRLRSQLCYSATRHRLYFVGPNDYLVTELDADTGEILSRFGYRPEKYRSLPKRYHGTTRGSKEEVGELMRKWMSYLISMELLYDRYLLVCHRHPDVIDPSAWDGIVYDLKTSNPIESYVFRAIIKGIPMPDGRTRYRERAGEIADRDGLMYMWEEPAAEVAEMSNGTIEGYKLSFIKH